MAKVKTRYVCQNCGYVSPRYLGRCPNCSEWNTLVEEVEQKSATVKAAPRVTLTGTTNTPQKIDTIEISQTPRVDTKNGELNRVLGGGVVPGSMVLIGGDPGIGKSTLLLQVSGSLADQGGNCSTFRVKKVPTRSRCVPNAWESQVVNFTFTPRPIWEVSYKISKT